MAADLLAAMNRIKALYRGWSIPCTGTQVYAPRYREQWLNKVPHAGVRRRAELLYEQLDGLRALRRNVRPEFLAESRKHMAANLPCMPEPCIRPYRKELPENCYALDIRLRSVSVIAMIHRLPNRVASKPSAFIDLADFSK